MSQPKPKPVEAKKWSLTKEELNALQGMGNVVGFIEMLVQNHMSKWIDDNVKTRLSIPQGQLVSVSLEKGEVSLVPNGPEAGASKEQEGTVHEGVHAKNPGDTTGKGKVQPSNEGVEEKKPEESKA